MSEIIILTEKPDAANYFYEAISSHDPTLTKKGSGYYAGSKITIISSYGHLCGFLPPKQQNEKWDKWKLEPLPIYPEKYKVGVKGGDHIKKRYALIEKVLGQGKELVVATDGDMEGEYIAYLIYSTIKEKINWGIKKESRVWLQNLTSSEILKKYENREPLVKYKNIADAGIARAKRNYSFGLSITRGVTLLSGSAIPIRLGTVKCPTLAIVVQRYLENTTHKVKTTWSPVVIIEDDKGCEVVLRSDNIYDTEEEGNKNLYGETEIQVQGKTKKNSIDRPPTLLNQTQFTVLTEEKLGIPALDSEKILQKLYWEAKIVTYPRTNSSYLKESQKDETKSILKRSFSHLGADNLLPSQENIVQSKHFNDSKVDGGHHAIIPSVEIIAKKNIVAGLDTREADVFNMICRHTAAAFMPQRKKETTTISFSKGYTCDSVKTIEEGYRKLIPLSEKEITLQGEKYKVKKVELREIKTKPKPLFTIATLEAAMATAGKEISDDTLRLAIKGCGIGSDATRKTIISELIAAKQIELVKKKIIPTKLGLELVEKLSCYDFFNIEKVAEFEQKLDLVRKGEYEKETFSVEEKEATTKQIELLISNGVELTETEKQQKKESVGECPKCGSSCYLSKKGTVYYCKDSLPTKGQEKGLCDWRMYSTVSKKKLPFSVILDLYAGKVVAVKGLTGKSGKTFGVNLEYSKEKSEYNFKSFIKKLKKKNERK